MLGKAKLNAIKVLISKALINTYISHDEFISVNNMLREYKIMKEEIKCPETSVEYIINMFDISRETYERNGVETIVDNDEILWLNKKHIEEELNIKNELATTIKYSFGYNKKT